MKKEKKVALITLLVMILNMFSPYSILFNNISNAATGVLGDDPIILNNLGVTTKGSNKILTVEIAAVTEAVLNGFDFQFKIDTSKITPCNKNTGAATTSLGMIMSQSDYFLGTLQVKNYDRNTNQFHFLATEPSGGTDIADNGYIPGQVGDDAIDVNGQGYSVYYPILKLSFKLDSSVDENSLPSDLFTLVPSGAGLPTGLKVNYTNESGIRISKDLPLATKGFTNAEKQIASISVKTNPTTTAYEHGDTIDLTGGVIQVTYDDNSTEYVDMIDPSVSIATGSPADVNNPIVKLDYKGQETSFNITVTDPIQSLLVATPMTQGEYDHGDTLNFAGLTLSAVTKSGSTTTISSTTPGLTISETTANINSPNFTKTSGSSDVEVRGTQVIKFTYDGKTAQQTIIVNDKIASINVVTQPNKTVFKYGETLDITGATVKVTLESGDTTNINLPDGSATVSAFDNTQTGSKQNLTVTINNKTASETIDVEAYNYVKETTLTEPTKVDYKYNEDLDVTGGRIKVNWANGTVSNVNLTTSMVTGYNKTQLGVQTLTISYTFTYTLSDGAQIQDPITMTYEVEVTNPAKTITITPPTKTEYEHGDSLDFTGGEIEVAYEDGTTQTKQITADMVKESSGSLVNMAPTASDYVNNEVSKTLVIKYKEDSVTGTVNYPIKIKNVVNKIEMSTNPTNTTYNIGDTSYKLAGGAIKVTRKAGNTEIVALTDNGVTLTNLSTLTTSQGTKEVTVTYEEKTTTFNITVQNGVTTPTKTTYNHGETLDVTGGKIEVTYVDGTTQDKELDVSMITESDGSPVNMAPSTYGDTNKESKTLLIKYQEDGIQKQENYTIDIINDVKQIAIQGTAQSQYNINDQLQPGLSILVTRASGVPEAITVTNSMLTNFSTATEGTRTATITYTENGITKTTTFVYTVKDTVTSISVKNGPTNATKYGEDIDLTGVTIDVVKGSGTTTIPVTKDMIKAGTYDPDKTGNQVIKIVYEGQETTLTINVKDYVTGITINPVSVTGKYNDTLSSLIQANNIQYTVTYAKAGAQTPEVLVENMVSGYTATSTQDQDLTVTYTDTDTDSYTNGQNFTTNLKVTLDDTITGMTLEQTGTVKTDYKYDEEFDVSNLVIVVHKLSGDQTVPVMKDMIKNYNKQQLGNQTVSVEYNGTTVGTINVTVKDYIASVVITVPSKITYKYNEELDLSDAKITITMASKPNEPTTIAVTPSMISGYNKTQVGAQTVTITYTDNENNVHTQTFGVRVEDSIKTITLENNNFKTNYKYGENLDLSGLALKVTKESGEISTVAVTTGMISGYNPNKLGSQTLTINYEGKQFTIVVNVVDYVTDIILTPPTKDEYKIGESLSLVGGSITEKMASGANGSTISLTNSMVSGFDSTTPGTKNLTVTYVKDGKTYTKTFQVAVINTINHIEVIAPTKTDYKYGENLNLSGGSVKIYMEDGTIKTVPLTSQMVTGYSKTTPGQQMLKVTYTSDDDKKYEGYFKVTVGEDYIKDTKFVAPTKKEYRIGDTIDLTGGSITEVYASEKLGNKYDLTNSMISGFDSTTPGTKQITVTFNNKTYQYSVTVKDRTLGISIKTLPNKLEYKKGENLDLTGATLNVVKESGTQVIKITADMVSGYDKNKAGIQVIKVTYEGFTTQFSILVKEEVPATNPDEPNTPDDNKPNTSDKNNSTSNTTPSVPSIITKVEESTEPEENANEETKLEEDNKNTQEDNKESLVSGTNDNQNNNTPKDKGTQRVQEVLNILGSLLVLIALAFIIIVLAKRRKNVKIYIEEGDEKVLVGKERLTKDNRELDLNKYYNKYKEDEYKIVLSKSISKKLDKKTVSLTVHDKKESFVVNYDSKEYIYKT